MPQVFLLETKARWAWHTKIGETHNFAEADEDYDAYERKVKFPTKTDTPAAQWLRQNPHDLPLGRISLLLDGRSLDAKKISNINQRLDLWQGVLSSHYSLDGNEVAVQSTVHAKRDAVAFKINSPLTKTARLSVQFNFPRGYELVPASWEDHPSMLAPTAFFNDSHIDKKIMNDTLDAVVKHWAFDTKIWGWDYPMLAMAAARLERPELAVQLLLMDSKNNHYLINGNCPQVGAELPVYLPANAALLSAVAIMLEKNQQTGNHIGFPNNQFWDIRAEGF